MIKSRLYLYDSSKSDFKGEDYSRYVLLGDTVKDDLTEVMGTIELTLAGVPSRKNDEIKTEEFTPETLFVYERADVDENGNDVYSEHWDMCVQNDTVSQPILSDDNYFDHHITLIEASAIAQKRLVDNIAVTYRLQDVTLEGQLNIDTNARAISDENQAFQGVTGTQLGTYKQWEWDTYSNAQITLGKKLYWEFADWFPAGNLCRGEKKEWTDFPYYLPIPLGQSEVGVNLPVPMLKIQNGKNIGTETAPQNVFVDMGYCSVRTVVTEFNTITEENTIIKDFVTNPYGAEDPNSHEKWTKDWVPVSTPNGEVFNYGVLHKPLGLTFNWAVIDGINVKVANYEDAPNPDTRRIVFAAKPNCIYTIKTYLENNFNYEFNIEGKWNYVATSLHPAYTLRVSIRDPLFCVHPPAIRLLSLLPFATFR